MRRLERRILDWCRREAPFDRRRAAVIALSGGPDSVALLRVLITLAPTLSLELHAAHVNHSLRGVEADQDQRFVEDLCRRFQIPLVCRRLSEGARRDSGNLEAAMRRRRYGFLLEEARRRRACLATGHTLDDQVETFFLRAARGAGVRGLAGIRPRHRRRGILVIRPLLDCLRGDVLEYLEDVGQPYRVDPSNRDETFDRNWVRSRLVPLLEGRLNPQIRQTLGRTMLLLREVDDDLRRRARRALRRLRRKDRESGLVLEIAGLNALSIALRREVVREAWFQVCGYRRALDLRHVDAVLELARQESGRSRSLPGCRVRREFDLLSFEPPEDVPEFAYELKIPGRVFVKELRRTIDARLWTGGGREPPRLTLRAAGGRITLRNRRPGDRIQLEGRNCKLKELLQDHRIPLRRRGRLLIVEQEGEIAAVETIGVADPYRVAASDAGPLVSLFG